MRHDHKNHQLGIDAYILELTDKWKYNSTMFKNLKNDQMVIFYTEILTGKVVLWCFFTSEWKNPQFNFSSQDISIERNVFKWDGKVTKISHLLFHRIWKNNIRTYVIYTLSLILLIVIKRKLLWYKEYIYVRELVNKMKFNMKLILTLAFLANLSNSLEYSSQFSLLKIFKSITRIG